MDTSESKQIKTESDLSDLLSQKYSELRPCIVEGEEEEQFTVWLKVGIQNFCITPYAGNRDEAEFMQRMFGKALEQIIHNER